jgi:hypothetical protein
MSTWIAVLSNDLDGESIKELEVEAESETEAKDKLDSSVYGEKWKHYSLVTIKKKRGGLRPGAGCPRGTLKVGTYGQGVKTKPVRVPTDLADQLPEMLQNLTQLKDLLADWEKEAASSTSPRYDRARKLIAEIKALGF